MKNLILHSYALLMLFFASITVYSATNPVNQDNNQLRSATAERENMLFISATKNSITTSTVIAKFLGAANTYDSEDIYKLFTPITEVVDIYSLAEGYALAFNKFSTYPFTSPIGIKTTSLGKVSLKFTGAESFSEVGVYLINAMDGTEQDLKKNPNYEFNYDGTNGQGILFVSFRKAGITTDISTVNNDENIQIISKGDSKIIIESSPNDLIREIILFNLSGNIVEQYCCFLHSSIFEVPADKNQIYLVQVFTDKKTRMAKVFVK